MQGMERQTWLLSWMGDGGVDNTGWKDGERTAFIRGLNSTLRTARTFGRLREAHVWKRGGVAGTPVRTGYPHTRERWCGLVWTGN